MLMREGPPLPPPQSTLTNNNWQIQKYTQELNNVMANRECFQQYQTYMFQLITIMQINQKYHKE